MHYLYSVRSLQNCMKCCSSVCNKAFPLWFPNGGWCFLEQTCLGTQWNKNHASWRAMPRASQPQVNLIPSLRGMVTPYIPNNVFCPHAQAEWARIAFWFNYSHARLLRAQTPTAPSELETSWVDAIFLGHHDLSVATQVWKDSFCIFVSLHLPSFNFLSQV